LGVKAQKSHKI